MSVQQQILSSFKAAAASSSIPTIVAVGTFARDVGAITPGLPAGTAQDDILVLALCTERTQAITVSGWTEAGSSPKDATSQTRLTVFWKRAGSSESAPTTSDSGSFQQGRIIGVRGCITTGNPFDVTNSNNATSASSLVSISGATTTGANRFVIMAIGLASFTNIGTDQQIFSTITNSNLANKTERADYHNGYNPYWSAYWLGTGEAATAGDYGTTTVNDGGFDSAYAAWTGALIPA